MVLNSQGELVFDWYLEDTRYIYMLYYWFIRSILGRVSGEMDTTSTCLGFSCRCTLSIRVLSELLQVLARLHVLLWLASAAHKRHTIVGTSCKRPLVFNSPSLDQFARSKYVMVRRYSVARYDWIFSQCKPCKPIQLKGRRQLRGFCILPSRVSN
jgi:hypothetical protein